MAYAQINFNEILGRKNPKTGTPPKYTIRQVGCFLTAFCNLRTRMGADTNPLTLNAFFRDRGIYTDTGDGLYDDLWWNSISAYDPNITVTGIHGPGVPATPHAIVRFANHFSLVDRVENGRVYIIDSADGKVKPASTYGNILGFATYGLSKPQPVAPPPPPPPPAPKVYASYHKLEAPITMLANKQPTNWFNLEFTSWEEAKSTKIMATLNRDTPFTAVGFAKHWMGGKYYMTADDFGDADVSGKPNRNNGVNIEDLSIPAPATPVTPVVTESPAESIPVTITPPSNEWKLTWHSETAEFKAKVTTTVKDLEGLQADIPLNQGDTVHAVGYFHKTNRDGNPVKYWQISKHRMNEWWYGVEDSILERIEHPAAPEDTPEPDEEVELYNMDTVIDDHDQLLKDTGKHDDFSVRVRKKWIALIAYMYGTIKLKQIKKQQTKE